MRTFISINLTDSLHDAIRSLQRRLEGQTRGIRWTQPESCHLTLKFLGDLPVDDLPRLDQALSAAAPDFPTFTAELGGLGQFPPKGPLSVLWVGVLRGAEPMIKLEQTIRKALKETGISFDGKPFSPHLTIARSRRDEHPSLRGMQELSQFSLGSLTVDAFHLMESILQPSGPIYTVRGRYPLSSI